MPAAPLLLPVMMSVTLMMWTTLMTAKIGQ